MARNKTLFVYNDSPRDQSWRIYSEGVIDQTVEVGKMRKTYTLSLSGNVTIQFGVDETVYLQANYTYNTDSWTSHTDTPKEISFSTSDSAVTVTSSYTPDENN
ncbi:MAG: hypothetical protein PVH61_40610 [Candidatus Aminicenantes bacterium]|jgi:hypothetical protein